MQFVISNACDGMLLRQYLQQHLHLSSKMMRHLKFLPDGITVNGTHVTVRYRLCQGDCLRLRIEDEAYADIQPVDLPVQILYEDEDIVVPNKPADMPTHPSCNHHEDTLANALLFRYRGLETPFVFRPINRLDRNTSGLLLIARNRPAAGRLTSFMQSGRIKKSYLAVLEHEMSGTGGTIDLCLHRTAQSVILREVCSPDAPDADEAHTRYEVLLKNDRYTLVRAYPLTGRTHQLRVHFAAIGHPIVGDDLYGKPSDLIGRHALHAHSLSFPHPADESEMRLAAELPTDFLHLLKVCFPDSSLADLLKELS